MHRYKIQGLSLIELLICLAMLGGLTYFGLNSMLHFKHEHERHQVMNTLAQTVSWTQNQAILWNRRLSICPFHQGSCVQEWGEQLIVFIDNNESHHYEAGSDIILKQVSLPKAAQHLVFNRYIPFHFRGTHFNLSASWQLKEPQHETLKLILSMTGRLRQTSGDTTL